MSTVPQSNTGVKESWVQVRCSEDLRRRLKVAAAEAGTTVQALVTLALERLLASERNPKPEQPTT